MSNEFLPKIPYGTRDLLPKEAKQKRELEDSLARLFSLWGYEETVTPTFEYLETMIIGSENTAQEDAFKFFDKNNRILALRTDMTTPIARVTATRLSETDLPIRLFYIGNVFRREEVQTGRQCEFYQAGVELLGNSEPVADSEVIALAVKAMLSAGLEDFNIGVGQVDFINGLVQESQLTSKITYKIKRAMLDRDLVGLGEILENNALSPGVCKLLKNIPLMHGLDDMLEEAYKLVQNDLSRKALDNLAEIYRLLTLHGVSQHITFDLGIIRDFDYYTGMVFEGYTNGLGFPVLGGGRYDNLLSSFGFNCPATGFTLGIERVLLALERQGIKASTKSQDKTIYVAFNAGKMTEAIAVAEECRSLGKKAKLALAPQSREESEALVAAKECQELIYIA